MSIIRGEQKRFKLMAASSAASLALVSGAFAQSNVGAGQVVISTAGSTALKNWFVAKTSTFTEIQPGSTLAIDGVTYPAAADGGSGYWSQNGGTGVSYQLAPKGNATINSSTAQQTAAMQFLYHESGSVEGILELANDQLYTNSDYNSSSGIASTSIPYITANVDRNPEGGNAVWLNYNQIGASGTTAGAPFNAATGAAPAGTSAILGNFYAPGVGQSGTPGATVIWTPGSASNPTPAFNQAGANVNGGQNAVQVALSDAIPQQVFQNNYGNTSNTYTPAGSSTPVTVTGTANHSFNANLLDQGYGAGNTALGSTQIGTPGFRATYQDPSVLNVSAASQDPRAAQGTTFGVGPWNAASNGGLGNLNSQLTAVTATAFVANPGTGLTQIDRTDADWIEMTSRFANGAGFNMTTRDVNSGTRDVSSLDTGVDPTYSSGKNDAGNGNLPNAVSNTQFDQEAIGPSQHFSNKTAGGAQLRPTVQNNRFAVGTLSINDAGGNDTQTVANPVRVLNYSDSTDYSAPAISPNYATISNGSYVIYQNEQVVTLKNMSSVAAYNASGVITASNGAEVLTGTVQGDDASGDVVAVLNNTANSVATASTASTPANPADGLLSQGYIIPSLMQVEKNFNGQGLVNSTSGQIDSGSITSQTNPNFNSSLYSLYAAPGGYGQSALPVLTSQEPTTGTGSTYGGKGGTFAKSFFNGGAINITNNNYIGGNFNQNGIRDYSALQSALNADKALIAADQAVNASVPGSEFTAEGDNNLNWSGPATLVTGGTNGVSNTASISYTSALGGTIHLTKGDLIVMGDYTGDGHFDGADLVALAQNTALADAAGQTQLVTKTYDNGVLVKNAAMDYLNANVGNTTGVDQYIRQTGRAVLEGTSIPSGATAITNTVSGTAVVDSTTGLKEFTYDPTGVNTFNKSDIQQAGTVDFNDAVLADNNFGMDYTNLAEQVAATQPAPITGVAVPLNLAMVKQSDTSTVIDATDVAAVNAQLTGAGTTNWYGFNVQKTGPSTISWGRTGGPVNVYSGASFEISNGEVNISTPLDPFTDSSSGNHVAVTIDGSGSLVFSADPSTYNVAALNVAANGTVDIGVNKVDINYGGASPLASIVGEVHAHSIFSSHANANYGVGYSDVAGKLTLAYALYGDITLSGSVNGTDFGILAAHFGQDVTGGWTEGDFTGAGIVNGSDFGLLAQNFGKNASGFDISVPQADWQALDNFAAAHGLLADVPEPTSIGLLAVGASGLLARRRRAKIGKPGTR
jgi:hypothetical protein